MTRPVGQAVKTAASHAANMGSIPVRVTNNFIVVLVAPKAHLSSVYFFVPNRKRFAGLRFGAALRAAGLRAKRFLTVRRKFDKILAVEKDGKERKALKFSLLTFFFKKVKESRKTPPSEAQRKRVREEKEEQGSERSFRRSRKQS